MTKERICESSDEGMFIHGPLGQEEKPDILMGVVFGVLLVYCFLGVAIIADIFMNSIETVTSWKRKSGKFTVNVWNETVSTLTLMALGSSAPEIFLAVIDNFKRGFHSGELGPSTIVGSASFNLFVIIAVCVACIPAAEVRRIENMKSFLVTAVFSVAAYLWVVFCLVVHGKDVVDIGEALCTFLMLPLLVWVSYSIDVGYLARLLERLSGDAQYESEGNMDDKHCMAFEKDDLAIPGASAEQEVEIKVLRKGGARSEVHCIYSTQKLCGVPGYDFEEVSGELTFAQDESSKIIKLTIPAKSPASVKRSFLLTVECPDGTCDFDPNDDGGADSAICTITVEAIVSDDGTVVRSLSKQLDKVVNKNSVHNACGEWVEQLKSAFLVNGSLEEQREAGVSDWAMHLLAVPWKVLWAFVPPPAFCGGWLCFFVSIIGIGVTTAVVSDIADMFGCLIGIPDIVTAITFVALGTSMPDLFASTSAAVGDTTADASIVNVTGSNSVNVFLGLGIPWTCASIYWKFFADRTDSWEERYPKIASNPDYDGQTPFVAESRNLGFCVLVFSVLCIIAIILLVMRRVYLGAELGGPKVPKHLSATLLVWLWVVFIYVGSWRVLACESQYEKDDWNDVMCGKSMIETATLAIGTSVVTLALCCVTFTSIYRSADEARAAAIEYLEKVHTPECHAMAKEILKQVSGESRQVSGNPYDSEGSTDEKLKRYIEGKDKKRLSQVVEEDPEAEARDFAEQVGSKEPVHLADANAEDGLEVWV